MSCASPIPDEQLVAYWADDLDRQAQATIEEHLFACDECFASARRVQRIAQALRAGPPPVISRAELDALRAGGATIAENTFVAGRRQSVTFTPGLDFMIHRLGGLDLAAADRVEVVVRSERGPVLFEEPFAPFDRERGEVLIACQRHFAALPPDVAFDVRVHRPAAPAEVATYLIPHVFVR